MRRNPRFKLGCAGNGLIKPTQRVWELRDERASGDGWFVYLKPGWALNDASTPNAQHCFGEDKKNDVYRSLRMTKPCYCDDCVKAIEAGDEAFWGDK